MANVALKTYIPNMGPIPSGLTQFKSATPHIDWWESNCQSVGQCTVDYGPGGTFPSEQAYGPGSIQNKSAGGIWTQSEGHGWAIKSLNNGYEHTNNIEYINNDKNRWMPAGMFYGLGFEIYQSSGSKHAMYAAKFAVIFKSNDGNSNRYRRYGGQVPGKTTGPENTYKYVAFNDATSINNIQNWGWNWHLYGVVVNWRNEGGAGSSTSSIYAYNFKVFHRGIANVSSNRILVPGQRHFNDRFSPNVWGT